MRPGLAGTDATAQPGHHSVSQKQKRRQAERKKQAGQRPRALTGHDDLQPSQIGLRITMELVENYHHPTDTKFVPIPTLRHSLAADASLRQARASEQHPGRARSPTIHEVRSLWVACGARAPHFQLFLASEIEF